MRYKKLAVLTVLVLALGIWGYFSVIQKGQRRLTLSDFEFLESSTSLDEVIERIGRPDRDPGFGLYHPQYDLADGGIVWLTFLDRNTLQVATYYGPQGNIVVLFERQE